MGLRLATSVGFALLAGLSALPGGLSAQEILVVGYVTDARLGTPLAGASVHALNPDGIPIVAVRSGSDGRYSILLEKTDIVRVRASALGYLSVVRSMRWPDGEVSQVVPFPLDPRPIEIDPLNVDAKRGGLTPGRELFREHRNQGKGTFITAADIHAWQPRWLPDLLLNVEGIWLSPGFGTPIGSRLGRGKCLHVLVDGWTVQAPGSRVLGIAPGITRPTAMYDDWRLDINPYNVGGIEVYPAL
jgi:hypothetical protein